MRLTAPHSSPITRRNFGVLAAAWFVFVSIPVDPSYSQAQEGVAAKPGDEIIVEFKGKRKRARVRRTVNITMDINHDGRIDKKDDDMEDKFSAVVIRDFDDVYVLRKDKEDKTKENDEPARRQLLVVQENNPALDSIAIERSSRNILIFKSATGNDELIFGNKRSHIVPPGRYWVQGGKNYSKTVGAEFLIAHPRQWQKRLGPPPSNKISLTVMWLDLEVRIGPGDHILKKPLFEDFENVKKAQGHDLLGVQRSRKDSEDKEQKVRAIAEIRGIVHPSKIVARNAKGRNENAFGKRDLTTGLWRSGVAGTRATAEFGFIFRRWAKALLWVNGSKSWGAVKIPGWPLSPKLAKEPKNVSLIKFTWDDSHPTFQDTTPDVLKGQYLIVDNDGPGLSIPMPEGRLTDKVTSNFYQFRSNFVEYVVFKPAVGKPQRVSERIKWAASLDFGRDYDDRAVFVGAPPNTGDIENRQFSNAVFAKAHLPDEALNPTLQKPFIGEVKLITVDGKKRDGNEIPRQKKVTLRVTGKNLIGRFKFVTAPSGIDNPYLAKDIDYADLTSMYEVIKVKADKTGLFSDMTEARITFRTGLPEGTKVAIVMSNDAGASNPVGHFKIIESP